MKNARRRLCSSVLILGQLLVTERASAQSFTEAATFLMTLREGLSQQDASYVVEDTPLGDQLEGSRQVTLVSEPRKCQLRVVSLKLNSLVISSSDVSSKDAVLAVGNLASIVELDFNQIELNPRLDYFDSGTAALTYRATPQFCKRLWPTNYSSVQAKLYETFGNQYSVHGRPNSESEEFFVQHFLTDTRLVFDVKSLQLSPGIYAYKDAKIRKANAWRQTLDYVRKRYKSTLAQDVPALMKLVENRQYVALACNGVGYGLELRRDNLIIRPRGTDSVNQAVDQLKRIAAASKYLISRFGCGSSPTTTKPY